MKTRWSFVYTDFFNVSYLPARNPKDFLPVQVHGVIRDRDPQFASTSLVRVFPLIWPVASAGGAD